MLSYGIEVTTVAVAAKLDFSIPPYKLFIKDETWLERIKGPYGIRTDEYIETVKLLSSFLKKFASQTRRKQNSFDFRHRMAPRRGDEFEKMRAFNVFRHKHHEKLIWVCRAEIIKPHPIIVFSEA